MKQIIQNFKSGVLSIEDVPQPTLRPQGVLVRNHYSLISLGTEGSTIKTAQRNILGKALERPDLVRKVINIANRDGLMTAFQITKRNLETSLPLGYSCAGTVIDVGSDISDIKIGDRLACGGGGYANHAEVVYVPRNLCVKLPDKVDFRQAAFVTIGAIAIQGVRHANVSLGEVIAVIGQGLIGLLTNQILHAAGCRVIGIDLDPRKIEIARLFDIDDVILRNDPNLFGRINLLTNGIGVDKVIITAATRSSDPVILAGDILRKGGRVVSVGKVGMNIPRETYVYKELQFLTSMSYGPGRYDPNYEEYGIDYPISYVRWTENRNMEAFVDFLKKGSIRVEPLITHEFPIEQATQAYEIINDGGQKGNTPVGILLKYNSEKMVVPSRIAINEKISRDPLSHKVRLGIIGAGNFASNVLIPILARSNRIDFRAITTAQGLNALSIGKKYQFGYCAESVEQIFSDSKIDAVMIFTRHDTHSSLVSSALEAGKFVYVEKPLAVNSQYLDQVVAAYDSKQGNGRVMVGFNRRFSSFMPKIKGFFSNRSQQMVITYLVNAGFQPRNKWIHDPIEGGGRIVGEVCHFVDVMQYITGANPVSVWSHTIAGNNREDIINVDNATLSISFSDGSIGTIIYASNGDKSFPKERIEVFCDSSIAVLDDFRSLKLIRDGRVKKISGKFGQDKGFENEMEAFINTAIDNNPVPVCFESYILTTKVTFGALESQKNGNLIKIYT
ncbi:MAG: oxidoreductase [Anaerolineales bacterium]|nr:MAG: oxidoreductase [Anaerolineales bacterium]